MTESTVPMWILQRRSIREYTEAAVSEAQPRTWTHDPAHRQGVPYVSAEVRSRYADQLRQFDATGEAAAGKESLDAPALASLFENRWWLTRFDEKVSKELIAFLVGVVVRLARGQSFAESGIFGGLTLFLDFTLLAMGAVTALGLGAVLLGVVMAIFAPLVGWARIRLKHHTPVQILIGWMVSMICVFVVFRLML